MPSKKSLKPEFYKYFLKPGTIPDSNKIVKCQESFNYWIFKSGKKVYKVKKKDGASSVSLDEVFCAEVVGQIQRHSPGLDPKIAHLKKIGDDFILDEDGSVASEILYYVIIMNQLPDRYFLSNIIGKDRLKKKHLMQIAEFLSSYHSLTESASSRETPTPDIIDTRMRDLFYQLRKYLDFTVSQGIIDMAFGPLEKYLADNKKLLLKRIKSGRVKRTHGCFVPGKVNVNKERVLALGATQPLKNRFADVTADVADLVTELRHLGRDESARYFVDAYCELTGDKEIRRLLPIYQTLKCLLQGLKHSVEAFSAEEGQNDRHKINASRYFEQIVKVAREM